MEKLCFWCKHFWIGDAIPDYSEYTPGSNFSMNCSKAHWVFDAELETEESFREKLLTALTCGDYEFNEDLKT